MSQAAIEQPDMRSGPSWRVAIIDDVYAGPTRTAIIEELPQFCAEVSANEELLQELTALTRCDFSDPDKVSDEAIGTLHKDRGTLTRMSALLTELFRSFDQRHGEVATIEGYLRSRGCTLETFHSVDGLFDGDAFELVFLDLRLARGDEEAQEIAKQIYEHSKAFILLMSNVPGAGNPAQAEEFRRKTRLIRGLFDFCAKESLCDEELFRVRMDTLPREPKVCHAVYDFVMSIDKALGGPIDEPDPGEAVGGSEGIGDSGRPLAEFIQTLRTLGLPDYALLCELTLRNEGHPLGDYMMRLLGSHLIAKLLGDARVRSAVGQLDKMRFSEFLPFGETTSASFNQMYADSLIEGITEPWTAHPWTMATETPQADEGVATPIEQFEREPAEPVAANEAPVAGKPSTASASEILQLLTLKDDGRELPFLQLGDLLIKNDQTLVYCVLSASCDLQFAPETVSMSRPRDRDDSVLLLPGQLKKIPPFSKARATTGLIQWEDNSYCIDWLDGKLLGVPHCVIRMLLEDNGYKHTKRLQIARALELQHTVLSWVSRIGLDVQPPFPIEGALSIFGRTPDNSFIQLGDMLPGGALVFHGRLQPALVLRDSAFYELARRMRAHSNFVLPQMDANPKAKTAIIDAIKVFAEKMIGMKLPILLPEDAGIKNVKLMDGSKKGYAVATIGLRVGVFDEAPSPTQKEFGFCLSADIQGR